MPLDLLSPKALWLLGLLAPLVVLYILKVKRQRLRIASTWLWQQARRDLMARSPFKKLVLQIPLVLQALALILLALAAARPASHSKAIAGDHIAIVVDTSASMATQDAPTGKSRIALAKEAALTLVQSLPPGSDAMILDAGRDTRVALPPDRDTRRMQAAIGGLEARDVEGDLGAAIALAVSRLGQLGGKRRIAVITDGNLARPAPLTESAVPIDLVRVGTPIDNAAIVRVDVRAGVDPVLDREQVQAFLLVANYGREARELYVTMRQHNASDTLASRKVLVPPGEKLPVVLTFNPAEGDYGTGLLFDIAPHDAMAVDDVAYGRVPSGRKLPVVVASKTEASPWLLRALASDRDAEVKAGKIDEALSVEKVPHDAFVVVEGACPRGAPGGDLLLVNPPAGECFGTVIGSVVEQPMITSWQHGDERMRFLTLDGVHVATARMLDPESQRQALITTDKGVIAADVSTHARFATLLAFDVGESNWPLKASFVLFMRNLLEQARQHRSSGMAGPASAGEPLRASVPVAVNEVEVQGPSGDPSKLPARDGLVVVPEVDRAGLYHVRWAEPRPGSMWIPVNLTSAAESDLGAEPVDAPPLDPKAEAVAEVPAHRDWSWVLACAALLFVMFDIWYFTRRPRRTGIAERPKSPHAEAA
jgi:hypothetical protein